MTEIGDFYILYIPYTTNVKYLESTKFVRELIFQIKNGANVVATHYIAYFHRIDCINHTIGIAFALAFIQ